MESSNFDQTQPVPGPENTQTTPSEATQKVNLVDTIASPVPPPPEPPNSASENGSSNPSSGRRWRLLIGLSLLALLAVAAASAFGGYFSGIDRRTSFESTQVAQQVSEQYQLGLQDLESRRYELARQRFEYVIQLDPAYPGVTDQLALVLLELNTTATPTLVPSPTLTPTPDTRGAEELFSQAQVMLADARWTEAIDTLLKLRKAEPAFQAVEVDSMLYVALRNRGVERILAESDLEGGTYDLALAERFGPLDVEADNYRTWANLYVTGASFWGLDWEQAIFYFGQLLQVAPNLRDATTLTASERYRLALLKYGDFLAESGDWCSAQDKYEEAYNFGSDPSIEPTMSHAAAECEDGRRQDDDDDDNDQETEPPPVEGTPTAPPPATTEPPSEATPTPPPPATTQPPYP
jgi:tetratricopeptide (TPR) repeat protein